MLKTTLIAGAASLTAGFGLTPAFGVQSARARVSSPNMASFYDFSATTIDGKEKSFADYKGKPIVILNVASL